MRAASPRLSDRASAESRLIQPPGNSFRQRYRSEAAAAKISDAAEKFLDSWLQANIADRPLRPKATLSGLVRSCQHAARAEGVSLEELTTIAGDLEQTILDEFVVSGKSPPKRR
jgi:hypothetical protein